MIPFGSLELQHVIFDNRTGADVSKAPRLSTLAKPNCLTTADRHIPDTVVYHIIIEVFGEFLAFF